MGKFFSNSDQYQDFIRLLEKQRIEDKHRKAEEVYTFAGLYAGDDGQFLEFVVNSDESRLTAGIGQSKFGDGHIGTYVSVTNPKNPSHRVEEFSRYIGMKCQNPWKTYHRTSQSRQNLVKLDNDITLLMEYSEIGRKIIVYEKIGDNKPVMIKGYKLGLTEKEKYDLKYPDNVNIDLVLYGDELESLKKEFLFLYMIGIVFETYPGSTSISCPKDKVEIVQKRIRELNKIAKKQNQEKGLFI